MSLIDCPECNNEISSLATNCPNCGAPINSKKEKEVITVQQTSKKLKAQQVYAALVFALGLFIMFGDVATGAIVSIGGFIWYAIVGVQTWWEHG